MDKFMDTMWDELDRLPDPLALFLLVCFIITIISVPLVILVKIIFLTKGYGLLVFPFAGVLWAGWVFYRTTKKGK